VGPHHWHGVLAVVAVLWSRLGARWFAGQVRYPAMWLDRSPPSLLWGVTKEI